jgi:hypothetical protein
MIEPTGTPVDVLGVANRQSKVPMGTGQTRQSHDESAPNQQAQDDVGFGTVGTTGISDNTPGKTRHSDCTTQAQDAGAVSGFSLGGEINKGAANTIGDSPIGGALRAGNMPKQYTSGAGEGATIFPGIAD